ncbi:hypothetical protein Vadar_030019 [Vaccinium darrowii]|uniref:Uncharacterized protein n=1 Tax=Vaccinium darrowii TaxID=229202 RepID=A0ACB7X5J7_9ERIC|nr:hypothetical protein Vadar_030019 [Vaccinium darrowii]
MAYQTTKSTFWRRINLKYLSSKKALFDLVVLRPYYQLKIDANFMYFLADVAVIAFHYGNPDMLCSPLVQAKNNSEDLVDAYAAYVKDYCLGSFGVFKHIINI